MAFDAFLKIDGIPGESEDDKYKDQIEVQDFNHELRQPGSGHVSGGVRSAERCDHGDFTIVKALDKATPKIAFACSNGEHLKEVTLTLCRAGKDKQKYMEYKLSDAMVRAVKEAGKSSGDGPVPLEEVSFAYGKIEWTYTELDHKTSAKKGDIKASWDLHSNKGS